LWRLCRKRLLRRLWILSCQFFKKSSQKKNLKKSCVWHQMSLDRQIHKMARIAPWSLSFWVIRRFLPSATQPSTQTQFENLRAKKLRQMLKILLCQPPAACFSSTKTKINKRNLRKEGIIFMILLLKSINTKSHSTKTRTSNNFSRILTLKIPLGNFLGRLMKSLRRKLIMNKFHLNATEPTPTILTIVYSQLMKSSRSLTNRVRNR